MFPPFHAVIIGRNAGCTFSGNRMSRQAFISAQIHVKCTKLYRFLQVFTVFSKNMFDSVSIDSCKEIAIVLNFHRLSE